ncbi:MAG TPA: hypothetical protein QF658_04135, partial [Pelagibacteraceae bacterium]|nr:hypothetical protein [Pelagibacteraceae bacterium]
MGRYRGKWDLSVRGDYLWTTRSTGFFGRASIGPASLCLHWGLIILFNHDSNMLLKKIKDQRLEKKFNLENQYDFLKLLEENKLKRKSWAINWYASLFVNKK